MLFRNKAILRFHQKMQNNNNRLKRIPHVSAIRRVRIDINLLPIKNPLVSLSKLPNLEEVTVWCNFPKGGVRASSIPTLRMGLVRAEKNYRVILEGEFLDYTIEPNGWYITPTDDASGQVVCTVRVSKGKLIWLRTAEDDKKAWRKFLTIYATLDVEGEDDK